MELLIIFVLTLFNGILAMSEAAIIAARKPRLEQRVQDGSSGAKVALDVVESPNRFLSTVQIGITLIGVLAGAFGGATVATDIAERIATVEVLEPYAEALGVGVIVAFTTYLSLIIGELVPKHLAIQNPESIASWIAPPMNWLSLAFAPLVWFLGISTNVVLWLLRVRDSDEPEVTEAEITVMVRQGRREGVFHRHEQEMVENVFRLDDLPAAALMTPRTEVVWLDVNDPPETWRETVLDSAFSRFPVKDDSFEHILGVVRAKDVLRALLSGDKIDLRSLAQRPIFVPETLVAPALLDRLRGRSDKLAVVIGEHGGMEGIVTVEDIIEAVVGDIEQPEAIQRPDGSWLVDGLMPLEEFKALMVIADMPDESTYHTVAGFVIYFLDTIPGAGERFVWEDFSFEVMDMDGNRVDKVLVSRLAEPDET